MTLLPFEYKDLLYARRDRPRAIHTCRCTGSSAGEHASKGSRTRRIARQR